MNVYDFIKYSGTNLQDYNELVELPDRLIDLFCSECQMGPISTVTKGIKCVWVDTYPQPQANEHFNQALKIYCNESIR